MVPYKHSDKYQKPRFLPHFSFQENEKKKQWRMEWEGEKTKISASCLEHQSIKDVLNSSEHNICSPRGTVATIEAKNNATHP